jgi:hypothetical protein
MFLQLSLFFSILSMIYFILAYYGIIRYVRIHFDNIEPYLDRYKSVPKIGNNRVVLAFTVDEKNVKKIKPFLISLLDQSVRVDDIVLFIPKEKEGIVPARVKKLLSVRSYDKSYTNPVESCSVLTEPEAQTKIIMVSPTILYGENFIEEMLKQSEKSTDCIVYAKTGNREYGMLIKPEFFNSDGSMKSKKIASCRYGGSYRL